MSKAQALFDEYGESHQNEINKAIHWVCIPAIMFSLFGLLYAVPFPISEEKNFYLNWGAPAMLMALAYYLRLSFSLFLGFALVGFGLLFGNQLLGEAFDGHAGYHALASLGIFVVAWIGQFIGHGIEGKKPSFLKDLQFLLIGPAWLLHFIFKKTGIPF
jgi:uncharacterized membrane protein YGL010W